MREYLRIRKPMSFFIWGGGFGDTRFGLKSSFFFRQQTYHIVCGHLCEQPLTRLHLGTKKGPFNPRHAYPLNIFEHIFGIVKGLFRVLSTHLEFNLLGWNPCTTGSVRIVNTAYTTPDEWGGS